MADGRYLPIESDVVDVVLLFQMLGDVPLPEEVLREAHRVLKEGGMTLVFETTCYHEHDLPNDFFRIMPAGLEFLAKRVGFSETKVFRLGGIFARSALLLNLQINYVFSTFPLIKSFLIGASNVFHAALDEVKYRPSFAPDYIAKLIKR
jgi:ubiquinone/menaquinone biosynthesis C-methylase UbiE